MEAEAEKAEKIEVKVDNGDNIDITVDAQDIRRAVVEEEDSILLIFVVFYLSNLSLSPACAYPLTALRTP